MHTSKLSTHYSQEQIDTLRLIRSHNIGPTTFHQLIALHGTASRALLAVPEMAARGGNKTPILASLDTIEYELEACQAFGAYLLTLSDPLYPSLLKAINYPPPILTIYGNTTILKQPSLAIVGARNSSSNGYRFAYHLAKSLSPHYAISSGMARGIDTAAHQGALENGSTLAVTACGIDVVYPEENTALYQALGERGIIVTEMPYGTLPKSQNFPKRNRIISGCSIGTIVVEAGLKSGSLITAHAALEQNRDVFAVPGSPLDARSIGTNYLIKQGAILVNSVEDILQITQHSTLLPSLPSTPLTPTRHDLADLSSLSSNTNIYEHIMHKLSSTPTDINDIIIQSDLTAGHILTILLELELAGKIKRYPGNKIALQSHIT